MDPSHLSCSLHNCHVDAASKVMESYVTKLPNYREEETNLLHDLPQEVESIAEYWPHIIERVERQTE